MSCYEEAATAIGKLVSEKNEAYGNSFADSAHFLKLLYPDGIPTDKYQDILLIVRVFDKLKRIATRKNAFGESPWRDITGYALLGVVNDTIEEALEEEDNDHAVCPTHGTVLQDVWVQGFSDSYCSQCVAELSENLGG